MSRYIAIAHHWLIDSCGFTVEEISAKTEKNAEELAHAMQRRLHSTFNKTAVQLIHIGDKALLSPRRLTIWERLSGHLDPKPTTKAKVRQSA